MGSPAREPFLRNVESWRPTKLRLGRDGRLIVPGARGAVAPGSLGVAALVMRWYAEQLPKHARGRLLDLGCGRVPLYPLYAPHVDEVLCADWPNSLHGQAFLDFACDLGTGVPLADASVDTVIASDVLEHVFRPRLVLAEIFRILKPGGTALINVPMLYCVHEAPHDYFRYTQFAVAGLAEEAGFKVETLDPLGGKLMALADIVGKLLQGLGPLAPLAGLVQRGALALSGPMPRSKKFPLDVAAVLKKP